MNIDETLALDVENEKDARKMQMVLRKFKSLSVFTEERIPLEEIEKAVVKLQDKYLVTIQPMFMNKVNGKTCYSIGIRNDYDGSRMRTVDGGTIYWLWCKVLLFVFSEAKRGNLRLRGEDV